MALGITFSDYCKSLISNKFIMQSPHYNEPWVKRSTQLYFNMLSGVWVVSEIEQFGDVRKKTSPFRSVSHDYLATRAHRGLGCWKLKYLPSRQKCHEQRLPRGGIELPWSGSAPWSDRLGKAGGVSGNVEVASVLPSC